MLILCFHIFQRGFEVLNAIFQASVYVTVATAITCVLHYVLHYITLILDILLVAELLIYSKKYFLI